MGDCFDGFAVNLFLDEDGDYKCVVAACTG